jgi:transposase
MDVGWIGGFALGGLGVAGVVSRCEVRTARWPLGSVGSAKITGLEGDVTVRATTLLNRMLGLRGVVVTGFTLAPGELITVRAGLRRRRLACPLCGHVSWARYDTRGAVSRWRHLDAGAHKVVITARLRRLACPAHGVITEAVPFARPHAAFTRDFEDQLAWLVTRMDKTSACRLARIDWDTAGRICQRVAGEGLDPRRLQGLARIGVDEVSWKKHHHYLTVVTDHDSRKLIWGAPGKDAAAFGAFFDAIGEDAAGRLTHISMDMSPAFTRAARERAPQAVICWDPFHLVKAVTEALDAVRRNALWDMTRASPEAARRYAGARWALLKRPGNLTTRQDEVLRELRQAGGTLWRAYTLKEAFCDIIAARSDDALDQIDRWCAVAARSRIPPMINAARTIRRRRDGLAAALATRTTNGLAEGLNNTIRMCVRRARGFHSPQAALALAMLTCGPITLTLPHERSSS